MPRYQRHFMMTAYLTLVSTASASLVERTNGLENSGGFSGGVFRCGNRTAHRVAMISGDFGRCYRPDLYGIQTRIGPGPLFAQA